MGELQRSWRRRNVYITLTEGKAKVKKSQDHRDLLTGQFSQTRAELAKFVGKCLGTCVETNGLYRQKLSVLLIGIT